MGRLKNTADWCGVLSQHLNQLWVHLTGEAAAAPDDQSVDDDDKQGQTIKPYLPGFVFCSLRCTWGQAPRNESKPTDVWCIAIFVQ